MAPIEHDSMTSSQVQLHQKDLGQFVPSSTLAQIETPVAGSPEHVVRARCFDPVSLRPISPASKGPHHTVSTFAAGSNTASHPLPSSDESWLREAMAVDGVQSGKWRICKVKSTAICLACRQEAAGNDNKCAITADHRPEKPALRPTYY